MASNPYYFIVQPHDSKPELHHLMGELQEHCKKDDVYVPSDEVRVGEPYAALHTDGIWYRATVENILMGASTVHVQYCDFGDVAVLSRNYLKSLPNKFRNLPKQAIQARIHGKSFIFHCNLYVILGEFSYCEMQRNIENSIQILIFIMGFE